MAEPEPPEPPPNPEPKPKKIDNSIWVLIGIGAATGLIIYLINYFGLNK